MPSTVVIGLGNTTLSDDAAGPLAARELARRIEGTPVVRDVTVVELGLGGLALMEAMVGYRRAVVLDALRTGRLHVGEVVELASRDLGGSLHETSVHDLSLPAALEVGRVSGLPLPDSIRVLGVEVADVTTFGERLSPSVEAALPHLVDRALELIADVTLVEPTCG